MRTKNWSKVSKNVWKLNVKPKGYAHTKVVIRKGYGEKGYGGKVGKWVVLSEHKVLKRAKTKKEIYKKTISWMRKHPNG